MNNRIDFNKTVHQLSGILLALVILIFAFSLINRKIDIDDGMIGEHAYWLATEGKVKSNLFWGNGIGWEKEQYHYHKLFVAVGALFIKLFGFSLPVLKSVSLASLLLFVFLLIKFMKSQYQDYQRRTILFLLIFLAHANIFSFSFIYRPEVMVMTLGFISFVFVQKSVNTNSRSGAVVSGVFTGLATLTHLNGLIFVFATVGFLVLNKKYKFISLYLAFFGVVAAFYFHNINTITALQTYWFQFKNDPALSREDFSWYQPIIKLTEEHKRFFHSPKESAFTVLFVISVAVGYKGFGKNEKQILQYLLLLVVGLAGLAHGTTSKYAILYYHFMTFLIVHTYFHTIHNTKPLKRRIVLTAVVMVYLVVEMTYNFGLINERMDLEARNKSIGNLVEKGSSVYANEYFIFNEIENFTIKSSLPLGFRKGFKQKSTEYRRKEYFELAKRGSNRYVVVDTIHKNSFYNNMLNGLSLTIGDDLHGYTVIHTDDGIFVFRLQNPSPYRVIEPISKK